MSGVIINTDYLSPQKVKKGRVNMNKRIEDIIAETRLNEILHKNEAEKQKNTVIWTLAIIGAVAAVAAIAYAVYRFVSPDYLDDFEDDFDDDFDDYFSEDDQV